MLSFMKNLLMMGCSLIFLSPPIAWFFGIIADRQLLAMISQKLSSLDLIASIDYQILFQKQNFGASKIRLVLWISLKDLHLVTVMLSLLSLLFPISLNLSKIFLSIKVKRFQELIQKMDPFKLLFLYRVYLQKLKLMIFFQQLKARLFSLGNAIHKRKTVGQSFWKNSGLKLMLTMKEQLQGGNMRLLHSLLDYPQRIIFNLNTMPIRLGLSLSNLMIKGIF